jgi:hypothetical protein
MGGMLLTDKLVFRWLEVLGVWSLDSATPFPSAYPVHASGSPKTGKWVKTTHGMVHTASDGTVHIVPILP